MSAEHPLRNECCTENGSPDATDASAPVGALTFLWVFSWLGTVAAGGIFGTLIVGVGGLVFGAIFAGVVGVPIHISMATVTWILWLPRFSTIMAGIAGALTGIAATLLIWDASFPLSLYAAMGLAALLGGLGGVLGGGLYHAKFACRAQVRRLHAKSRWQFSLRDLLVRVTVLAVLLSGWTWLISAIHDARTPISETELRSRFQQHRSEFDRLALMLRQDEGLHTIYSDGSYDTDVINRQRGAEYLALLRRARLSNSWVHSSVDGDIHRIEINPEDGFWGNATVGYVYSTAEPPRCVDHLADVDAGRLGRAEYVCARLGDDWYLFIQGLY